MEFQIKQTTEAEEKSDDKVKEYFLKLAGDDMEVDWVELKDILDYSMRNGEFIVFLFLLQCFYCQFSQLLVDPICGKSFLYSTFSYSHTFFYL